jgi:hypothetical protein
MDKYKYKDIASPSGEWVQENASSVAQAVEQDFSALIAIFNGHLDSGIDLGVEAKSALSEARGAAERGLKLSRRLIDLLRESPAGD